MKRDSSAQAGARRLLFLWDADAFGGHDRMALDGLERLAGEAELTLGVLHTGRNSRLEEELERIARQTGRLEVIRAQAAPAASESIDGLWGGPRTRSLMDAIGRWRPDCAVAVQGFITLGLCALGACRKLHVPVVSYVPMTHRIWLLRRAPVSILQDFLNRFWYAVPAAFITISARMKDKLVREQGVAPERISVVECGIDVSAAPAVSRTAARQACGLPEGPTLGVIGRVEFAQKRQDFLIRAVARHRAALDGYRFAIVGDGPDLPAARRLAERLRITDRIAFLPWQKDMSALYPALDAVLIPSRYEGVPLVMLEAMARRIPVLASDVDGMADVLPEECLFCSGNVAAMVEKIRALPGLPGPEILERLANLAATRFSRETFVAHFAKEIARLAMAGQVGTP